MAPRTPAEATTTNRVRLLADLHLQIAGAGGDVSARLRSDGTDGLALDVDHPRRLLRALPTGRPSRLVPAWLPPDLLVDNPLTISSGGRPLARVNVGPDGRSRLRPLPAGIAIAVTPALSSRTTRALAAGGAAVAAALVGVLATRRSGRADVAARQSGRLDAIRIAVHRRSA